MAEDQGAALAAGDGGEGEQQILDIDPAQLAALLAQSQDGTAQLIDEHGNTITLTAEQLAEAGIDIQYLDGNTQVVQLAEGQQYIQGEDGQIYIIEGDDAAVAAAMQGEYIDANSIAEATVTTDEPMDTNETDQHQSKSQLEQRYPQSSDQGASAGRSSGFSPTPKQLQVSGSIMAAPKPTPSMSQQSSGPSKRQMASGDHDQHISNRREHLVLPKSQ